MAGFGSKDFKDLWEVNILGSKYLVTILISIVLFSCADKPENGTYYRQYQSEDTLFDPLSTFKLSDSYIYFMDQYGFVSKSTYSILSNQIYIQELDLRQPFKYFHERKKLYIGNEVFIFDRDRRNLDFHDLIELNAKSSIEKKYTHVFHIYPAKSGIELYTVDREALQLKDIEDYILLPLHTKQTNKIAIFLYRDITIDDLLDIYSELSLYGLFNIDLVVNSSDKCKVIKDVVFPNEPTLYSNSISPQSRIAKVIPEKHSAFYFLCDSALTLESTNIKTIEDYLKLLQKLEGNRFEKVEIN